MSSLSGIRRPGHRASFQFACLPLSQPECHTSIRSGRALAPNVELQLEERAVDVPFARSQIGNFFQEKPSLGNQYLEDSFLQRYLQRHLPPKMFVDVNQDLERFGARLTDEIDSLSRECELNPPRLQQYDSWGKRVDLIITCSAWKRMKDISAEEGLIAEAYERRYSSWRQRNGNGFILDQYAHQKCKEGPYWKQFALTFPDEFLIADAAYMLAVVCCLVLKEAVALLSRVVEAESTLSSWEL